MSAIINEQNKISHKAFAEYTKEHWTVLVASIPHRAVGAEQVAPEVANLVEQFAEVNDLGCIGARGTGYRRATGNASKLVFHSHPTAKEKRDSTLVLTGTTIYRVALDNALMWCVDSDWCSLWYAQVTNDKASDEVRREIQERMDALKKQKEQAKPEEKESDVKQDAKQVIEGQPTWDKWGKVNDASVTFPMEKLRNFMKLFGKKDRDGASVLVTTNGDTVTLNGHAAGLNVSASFTGTVGKNAPKAIVVPLFCEFWKANDISKVALTYSETELWVWCWMPTKGGGDRQSVTYTLKAYQGVAELEKKLGIANDMCTEKDTAKAAERDRLAEENAKLKKQVASLMGTESDKVRKLNAEVKRLNEELRKVSDKQNADHAETVLELERSIKELKNQLADAAGLSAENEELHKQVGELLDQLKSVTSTVNGFDKLKFKLDFTDDGVFVWIDDPDGVLTGRIIKGVTKQGVKLWFEYFPGNDESDAKILRIAGLKSNQCRDLSKRIGAPVTWSNKLKQAWRDNPEYVEPGKVA